MLFLIYFANWYLSSTKNNFIFEFLINSLAKYIKNNIYGKKIVIGMGAGTISTWMREMPKYL